MVRCAVQTVDRQRVGALQHGDEVKNLFRARGSGLMISLVTPLSELEITELDEFLVSEATPGECMDISALDGFLTALVIGPGLVPPSVWIRAIWAVRVSRRSSHRRRRNA